MNPMEALTLPKTSENAAVKIFEEADVLSFKESVKYGQLYTALALIQKDKVPFSVLKEPEIFEEIKDRLMQMYANPDRGESAETLVENFKIDAKIKADIVRKAIVKNIINTEGRDDRFIFRPGYMDYLKKEGGFSEEDMQEIGSKVAEELLANFNEHKLRNYLPELEKYGLINQEKITAATPLAIKSCLSKGDPDRAADLLSKYLGDKNIVSTEEITEAGKKKILNDLQGRLYIPRILEDRKKYCISDDFFQSQEIKESIGRHLINSIREGDIRSMQEIDTNFSINESSLSKEDSERAKIVCLRRKVSEAFYDSKQVNSFVLSEEFEANLLKLAKEINFEGNPFDDEEIKKCGQGGVIHWLKEENSISIALFGKIKKLFAVEDTIISEQVPNIIMERDQDYKDAPRQKFRGYFNRKLEMLDSLNIDVSILSNNKDFLDSLETEYRKTSYDIFNSNDLELVLALKERNLVNERSLAEIEQNLNGILGARLEHASWKYKEGKDAFTAELDNLVALKDKLGLEITNSGSGVLLRKLIEDISKNSESPIDAIAIVKEKLSVPESEINKNIQWVLDGNLHVDQNSTKHPHEKITEFQKIRKGLNLSYSTYGQALEKFIIGEIGRFRIEEILEMKMMFKIPDEKIESMLGDHLYSKIEYRDKDVLEKNLQQFEEKFAVLGESVQRIKKNVLVKYLGGKIVQFDHYSGDITSLINTEENQEFIKKYNFNEKEINEAIFSQIIDQASRGNIDRVVSFLDVFDIKPEAIFANPDIKKSFFEGVVKMIQNDNVDELNDLMAEMHLELEPGLILDNFPEAKFFLEYLRHRLPSLSSSFPASLQEVISIVELSKEENAELFWETIDQNPFLIGAIEENQRFAKKLIMFFQNFDGISKENIGFLYKTKEQILAKDPGMDQGSSDFRQAMQEALRTYKNNSEILEHLATSNINIESWLNYDHEEYFQLGQAESLPFSVLVRTPVLRIRETIEKYTEVVKNGLRDFQSELHNAMVTIGDVKEIETRIAKMESELEKARLANDQDKVQGIERGIVGWKIKKENLKQVSVWLKLNGDIEAVNQISDKVIAIQEEILGVEENMRRMEVIDMAPKEKRRAMQTYKERVSFLKDEFKKSLDVMELRMENFQKSLPEIIRPILGSERESSLTQETAEQTGEALDHYRSDYSTLKDLFSEQLEGSEKRLEGRPMRVQIWSRNPDTDLYLGNYTNCCIRIDSTHMGSESTIADYLTDLGVQIVEIVDERNEEPVAVAWLFVGQDENGQPGLVIDNIEANTKFSSRFGSQLTDKFSEYVKKYAAAANLSKVVQGQSNNDLVVVSMDGNYKKLGGYNRSDGYFLEAEDALDDEEDYDDNQEEDENYWGNNNDDDEEGGNEVNHGRRQRY